MIRLTNPLFWEGRLYDTGREISLPGDVEEKIIANGNGKRIPAMDVSDEWFETPEEESKADFEDESEDVNEQQSFEPMGRSL